MDRGEPQHITVVTETRNLRTLPFVQNEDLLSTGKQWEEWIEGIEREFRYFRITEPVNKKDNKGNNKITELRTILQRESQIS